MKSLEKYFEWFTNIFCITDGPQADLPSVDILYFSNSVLFKNQSIEIVNIDLRIIPTGDKML